MKKTIKTNIKGTIFHIDEDGYKILETYLDKITTHYKNTDGGKEIIDDIETRITEIFRERIKNEKQVITIDDVREAIKRLGEPEEIFGNENTNNGSSYYQSNKKLYRDPDGAVLGGVCSGLAAYFDMDKVWMRLIFIILFLINGLGLLIYLIMWVVVPPAVTTAQRLEMRGEKVNISNIERTIKEEYETVKDNLKNYRNSRSYSAIGRFFEEIGQLIGTIIKFSFKFILAIIGFSLIVGGFFILISF